VEVREEQPHHHGPEVSRQRAQLHGEGVLATREEESFEEFGRDCRHRAVVSPESPRDVIR